MKKSKAILMAIVMVLAVLALFAGCEKEAKTTTVEPDHILIDAERNYYGGIDIYVEGRGFDHWHKVTDFVKGDPAEISTSYGLDPIYGIFVILDEGSNEAINMAIFQDGRVNYIGTHYKLLPRAGYGQPYVFCRDSGGASVTLTLEDTDNYLLSIKGVEQSPVEVNGVDDAWVAYDTIYWLVGDIAYSLDWLQPGAEPEVYFSGANAVSHNSDESEGALVPLEDSNYSAYGRSDIYSPYGVND